MRPDTSLTGVKWGGAEEPSTGLLSLGSPCPQIIAPESSFCARKGTGHAAAEPAPSMRPGPPVRKAGSMIYTPTWSGPAGQRGCVRVGVY